MPSICQLWVMRCLIQIRPLNTVEQQPLRKNTRGNGKNCFGPSVIVFQDASYFLLSCRILDSCQIRRLLLFNGLNPNAAYKSTRKNWRSGMLTFLAYKAITKTFDLGSIEVVKEFWWRPKYFRAVKPLWRLKKHYKMQSLLFQGKKRFLKWLNYAQWYPNYLRWLRGLRWNRGLI
jgi:hypothetical protein